MRYSLAHMSSFFLEYMIPEVPPALGRPGKAAHHFRLYVEFSHHCWSKGLDPTQPQPPDEETYGDTRRAGKDIRQFCPDRWAWSKVLKQVIKDLNARDLYTTGRHNFLTIETAGAVPKSYAVYFRVDRWHRGDSVRGGRQSYGMKLTVESAYDNLKLVTKSTARVSWNLILLNVLDP